MNYLESIAYLDSLSPTLEKPSLTRITDFLSAHGNEQNRLPCFHVGGTNGKGSTVAVLDTVLRKCGFKVGRFTGPHLLRWNERFHVDGKPITDEEFALYATKIRAMSEEFGRLNAETGPLTWFEFITALAFAYFVQSEVDVAVIEVGLGGRFDATNVISNVLATIITNIDLDHTQILGETEELIAWEKAGIIKPGVPVICGATGAPLDVIKKKATASQAPLLAVGWPQQFALSATKKGDEEKVIHLLSDLANDCHLIQIAPALTGEHQKLNSLLAFAALGLSGYFAHAGNRYLTERIKATLKSAWVNGIEDVYWPGRMQQLCLGKAILDGAHNPAGARSLRKALSQNFPEKSCLFVVSCFDNKNAAGILEALIRPGDRLFFAEAATRRATFPTERLKQYADELNIQSTGFASIEAAFLAALEQVKDKEIVVATGSFATVRESMLALGWLSVEDGQAESVKIGSSVEVSTLRKHRSGN
jgi:dihydrofolate synthase / folylpolyglutamate synthase